MTPEQRLVDTMLRAWTFYVDNTARFFAALSDEQLEQQVAPGRNRLIYLLGHIAAVHDRMLPLLGAGERLHPELDETFIASPDSGGMVPFSGSSLKQMLVEINATLWSAYTTWSPAEWLSRHTAMSDEDFVREPHRNRASVLLSRTGHLASHYGQLILTRPRE